MTQNTPEKKTPSKTGASKKTTVKKAAPKKAAGEPAKRGRPAKKAVPTAQEDGASASQLRPSESGKLVTANDVVQPSLRRRMLKWFKKK